MSKRLFYEEFGKRTPTWIEQIKSGNSYQGQPDFITFFQVNGVEHAFLGNETLQILQNYAVEKMYQTFRLFIPKGAQMVDVDRLKNLLEGSRIPGSEDFDHAKIPNDWDIFRSEKIKQNIELFACANISPYPDNYFGHPRDFRTDLHLCDGFDIQLDKYSNDLAFCDWPFVVLSAWTDNGPQYMPVIFHVHKDDIDKEILSHICVYYREDCDSFFLLPAKDPNFGDSYICIANSDNYPFRFGKGVKSMLATYIDGITSLKSARDAMFGIDDVLLLPIDKWNSCIYKDALLFKKQN